jgi:hypothetical protein
MIKSWRREFSSNGLTDEAFPFGVISMHAWCGEVRGQHTVPSAPKAGGLASGRLLQL